MIGVRYITALAAVFSICTAAAVEQEHWTTTLLKRQAPGTPAYDCHYSCGTAITVGRTAGTARCSNSTFLDLYQGCLDCSAPDNINIWQFYGGTLTGYGSACGLSTTPVTPSTSTSSAIPVSSTAAPTSSTAAPTVISTTSSTSASSSSAAATVTTSSSSTSSSSSVSTTSVSSSTSASTSIRPTSSLAGNSTTTVPFTGSANLSHSKFAGAFAVLAAAILASCI